MAATRKLMYDEAAQVAEQLTDDHGKPQHHNNEPLTASEEVAARFVHRDARKMFAWCPWMRHVPVYGEACEGFGPKCTWALGLCYFMSKGLADYLIQNSAYAMLVQRFGIDGERYQRLFSIVLIGWSIKAFTAVLCDSFAFMGYTKRWYMLLSCVAGAVFALVYGLLPAKPASADIAAAFIFLTCYCKANVDILSEGHYSRLMRRNPAAGPSLISWIWWFVLTGALLSAVITGPLADAKIPHVAVFIAAGLQISTGVLFIFNWYGERTNREERAEDARRMHEELLIERARVAGQNANGGEHDDGTAHPYKDMHPEKAYSDEEQRSFSIINDPLALDDELRMDQTNAAPRKQNGESDELILPEPIPCMCGLFEFNKEVVRRNWRVVVYSVVMTCAVVAMTCGSIMASTLGLLIICIAVSVTCCGVSFWALPRVVAKANVFGYLQMMLYFQMQGAVDSFYMATPDCVPDGPHFSYTFYNTVGQVIANLAGLVGVMAFTYVFKQRSFKVTFISTTIIQVVASIFDIVIVKRWNVRIGIPDHAMYICGASIVYQICYMLNFMPMTILLSRLCPRGSESVVYALMSGFSNLGQTASSSLGAVLMGYAFPIKTQPPCDFSNVPWLLFVGHMCAPLLVIPLTFFMLPKARICDDLDMDGNVVTKHTSDDDNNNHHHQRSNPDAVQSSSSSNNNNNSMPDAIRDVAAQ